MSTFHLSYTWFLCLQTDCLRNLVWLLRCPTEVSFQPCRSWWEATWRHSSRTQVLFSVFSDIAQAQVWPQTPNPPTSLHLLHIWDDRQPPLCRASFAALEMSRLLVHPHASWASLLKFLVLEQMYYHSDDHYPVSWTHPPSQCVFYAYYIAWFASKDRERKKDYLKNWKPAGLAKGMDTWLIICSAGTWKTDKTAWVGSLVRPGQPGYVVRHCLHKQKVKQCPMKTLCFFFPLCMC